MSNARLREALTAGNGSKEKGPPAADGVLSVTPDAPETADLRARRSAVDCVASSSSYLEDEVPGESATYSLLPSEIPTSFLFPGLGPLVTQSGTVGSAGWLFSGWKRKS